MRKTSGKKKRLMDRKCMKFPLPRKIAESGKIVFNLSILHESDFGLYHDRFLPSLYFSVILVRNNVCVVRIIIKIDTTVMAFLEKKKNNNK